MCAPPQALKNFGFHSNNMKSESSIHKNFFLVRLSFAQHPKNGKFSIFLPLLSTLSLSDVWKIFILASSWSTERGEHLSSLSLVGFFNSSDAAHGELIVRFVAPLADVQSRGAPDSRVYSGHYDEHLPSTHFHENLLLFYCKLLNIFSTAPCNLDVKVKN